MDDLDPSLADAVPDPGVLLVARKMLIFPDAFCALEIMESGAASVTESSGMSALGHLIIVFPLGTGRGMPLSRLLCTHTASSVPCACPSPLWSATAMTGSVSPLPTIMTASVLSS